MENYFNYFTEVEEYFCRRRGKHLMVSPLDWGLIELWKESGIPLHVVLRGIDRSFDSSQRGARKPPSTLFYCHPAIQEAFEEYRQARIGAPIEETVSAEPTSGPSPQEIRSHLEKLEQMLSQRSGETWRRLAARVRSLREEVGQRVPDSEQLDRELSEAADQAADSLAEEMGKKELQALKKDVGAELKIYRKRLSKEMYQRLEENTLRRRLREKSGVPEFSLFNLL